MSYSRRQRTTMNISPGGQRSDTSRDKASERDNAEKALAAADEDIKLDPDMKNDPKTDDLDEGELARFESGEDEPREE